MCRNVDVRQHLVSLRRHHVASESGNWGRRNLNNTITTPCYTLPPTKHYSFFRNLPPLLKIINLRDRTSFDSGNFPFQKTKIILRMLLGLNRKEGVALRLLFGKNYL